MAVNHFPSIMVITDTRVGGDKAAKIIEDLPFDGFFVTETIGYAGGVLATLEKRGSGGFCVGCHRTRNSCNHQGMQF